MIVDNGKQYYADLYLIKKGRDRVIEGLIHASIAGRDVESLTYEQKLAANQA